MSNNNIQKEYDLLKEKFARHEQILIQAYKMIKKKEQRLKEINDDLALSEEELKANNEELTTTLQRLKETQAQLFHAEKMASLGVLTAGVSHEINNPLNYIMGAYTGLKRYFDKTKNKDKQVEFLLHSLKEGIERAAQIVKGLGYFSKDNKKNDEECDIHKIIDNCVLIIQNKIKHRIEVEKKYQSNSIIILGNEGRLHRAFLNVLINAYQAITDKGKITISTHSSDNAIKVSISDTGEGIDERYLDKITDPFFTTKSPGKGTGLGLAITYNIVKEHDGVLKFISKKQKGTTVIITFTKK